MRVNLTGPPLNLSMISRSMLRLLFELWYQSSFFALYKKFLEGPTVIVVTHLTSSWCIKRIMSLSSSTVISARSPRLRLFFLKKSAGSDIPVALPRFVIFRDVEYMSSPYPGNHALQSLTPRIVRRVCNYYFIKSCTIMYS